MKVIDLLNKIAKGENVPIDVYIEDRKYSFDEHRNMYYKNPSFYWSIANEGLDTEIKENDNIEKLKQKHFNANYIELVNKINEIINKVNKL